MPIKLSIMAATTPDAPAPVRLFVRRGAVKRFEALKRKTEGLQVEVCWDRREQERRDAAAAAVTPTPPPASGERRSSDRRTDPTFTWDLADFAIGFSAKTEK